MMFDMSEAPAGVATDFTVGVQVEPSVSQVKKELIDPRTISKNKDQEGRGVLVATVGQVRKEKEEIKTEMVQTESELQERQENILVKLRQKLNIPDKKTLELQEQLLEAHTKQDQLPDPKKMIEAYYEKTVETPLTNQEKRDLLKPEVLSQLSTDEYIALWRRLNPHFMTHATPQGFRDHSTGLLSRETLSFHNGLIDTLKDEKQLKSRFAINGLTNTDEVTVTMFLSKIQVLQQVDEAHAQEKFQSYLRAPLFQPLPGYPDGTSVHLTPQYVYDAYLGEIGNGVFFCFPTDVIASQHIFGLAGDHKDLRKVQGDDRGWDDVFIWPNTQDNPGIPVDSGIVFLPENTQVDPNTGSRYASEVQIIDGKEKVIMIEDRELVSKYSEWANNLYDNSEVMKVAREAFQNRDNPRHSGYDDLSKVCLQELINLGFKNDKISQELANDIKREAYNIALWDSLEKGEDYATKHKDSLTRKIQELMDDSCAKFKKAENTISAKEYWENYFSNNPNLEPKHIVYYNGNPTTAIYKFQQENGLGVADTSKEDGPLLGFDDHFVLDIARDPRGWKGYDGLVGTANKIIKEHYAFK
jgi:hypothetical protein